MNAEQQKRHAARTALEFLPDAGILGLGTGSTTRYFIEGVSELVKNGRDYSGVPTSEQSRLLASSLGIPLLGDDGPWDVLLCVDGADEVSEELDLIKGGGGAHTREKIVNFASRRNVIVVDESKLSRRLGERRGVPVEVLPFAHHETAHLIGAYGTAVLRYQGSGPLRTDSGNLIYDLECGPISDPRSLDMALKTIPGVVETGLFCGRADAVIVARTSGIEVLKRAA
ncbi:MAG TPA: ribose-5-phosphate isomerase RpiA, partial [Polyangiaceae bacterium]|nr:ribose-5-phosphate isomerase RpiA [Polyangiaceae bacterium]